MQGSDSCERPTKPCWKISSRACLLSLTNSYEDHLLRIHSCLTRLISTFRSFTTSESKSNPKKPLVSLTHWLVELNPWKQSASSHKTEAVTDKRITNINPQNHTWAINLLNVTTLQIWMNIGILCNGLQSSMLSVKYEIAKIQESNNYIYIYSIDPPCIKNNHKTITPNQTFKPSLHGRVLQALRRLDPRWVSVPSFASTWKLMVKSKYPSDLP